MSRWPQDTMNVMKGATLGVVNTEKKSWKVFVLLKNPATLQSGAKIPWCDAAYRNVHAISIRNRNTKLFSPICSVIGLLPSDQSERQRAR
jgi:hypothetical protein